MEPEFNSYVERGYLNVNQQRHSMTYLYVEDQCSLEGGIEFLETSIDSLM